MKSVFLYTTSGCHLCKLAEQMLDTLAAEDGCLWQPVEISDDDQLIERYGIRIPVVRKAGKELDEPQEIGWPFSLKELQEWL